MINPLEPHEPPRMQGRMPLAGPFLSMFRGRTGLFWVEYTNIQKKNSETQSLALKGLVKLLATFV